ncbi:MAG: monovalent cation/H(+) antiporter subunit G [Burkholderiaceae bacterium]
MGIVFEWLAAVLILVGAFFGFMGSFGLMRLPDFFCRLHAPTKSSTLGVGGVLLAALVLPLSHGAMPGVIELLLTLFIFISAPVSANMLSLAALRLGGLDRRLDVASADDGGAPSAAVTDPDADRMAAGGRTGPGALR